MPQTINNYIENGCGRCSLGGTPDCKVNYWRDEIIKLKAILLDCNLTEEIKWSVPCYTFNNNNVILLSALKDCATLSFFKGALMKDSKKLLIKPGENSQATRYMKFTDTNQIDKLEHVIRDYISEAIAIEKQGLTINFNAKNELNYPDELLEVFSKNPNFKVAFEKLTPGRKRGYILFFEAPKQSKTKTSRIEKCIPQIFLGKGINGR